MSFRRRSLSRLRPVMSLKHVVDTNGGITGAGFSTTDVIVTVNSPNATTGPNQCAVGSTVGAIYLRVEVIQEVPAGGIDNIYMMVYKNPGGDQVPPAVDSVGTSDERKWVIHQEMMMTGTVLTAANAIPRTLFKGVILIPRHLKRNAVEDKLQVVIGHRAGEATQVSNFCLQCIYKEFR